MKPPCDEVVIRSGDGANPCVASARVWVLIATILGSSMAFIDSTVVNVALPALQANFRATIALDGSLPPQVPEDPKLSSEELIRKWRPIPTRPDGGATSISWYHQWLFRWSFYAFPDSEIRDLALDLALERQ